MANTCTHAKYATSISARAEAARLGLRPRDVVEKCGRCRKWKVVV